jgi:hypothetical protein
MYLQHPGLEQVWPTDKGWVGEVIFVITSGEGIGVYKHSELQSYLDDYFKDMQGESTYKQHRVSVKFPGHSDLDGTQFQWGAVQVGDDEVVFPKVEVVTTGEKIVVWEGTVRVPY